MNINNFKAQLSGGGARANLFRVQGTFPAASVAAAGLNPANSIQFLCRAAAIPSVTLGLVTAPFQGRQLKLAGDREFSEWTITIINDTNFALRNAFEKWSDVINRVETNVGRNGLSQYAQQWTVTQLDRQGQDVKTYTFIDCWPTAISDIQLNSDPVTTIEEFTVTLQYQYYQMEGTSS
jgi:hypothetical protein